MDVLHVAQPTLDGVALCVERLAIAERAAGWRVGVACPEDGPLSRSLAAAGVDVWPWAADRAPGASTAREIVKLSAIVRRFNPDVVHLHSSKAGLAGRLAVRHVVPTIFHPHAWSFEAVTGRTRRAALAWERFATRWTDLVLCCSTGERAAAERSGIDVRMEVVGNGVDLSAFPVADEAVRASARERLDIGRGAYAVCIGRLMKQKGQDLLLDAWPAVLERVPDAWLALVGDGEDQAALAARATPHVTLAGRQPRPADWLAAADVVVFPSRYEGLSLTLLEAMATGRSVVAHDVEGMADALGSEAGALVPTGNRAALATAIVERFLDPARAAVEGGAGRARVEAEYSLDAWIKRVVAATESVVAS